MSVKTIESMLNWVDENIRCTPTLEQMADYVGYSPYYCSNKFHEFVGMTFKQYISERKLMSATKDLLNTNMKVLEIAIKYGFKSHEAFTRAFIKKYGISPINYRRNYVENEDR